MMCYKTVILILTVIGQALTDEDPSDPSHWKKVALEGTLKHLNTIPNTNIAKNVLLFIGDGMGISTITAARILKGQLNNKLGEETVLSFEEFPYSGLSKVYSVDKQVPDSAATATAMYTGVKTLNSVLGVDSRVTHDKCKDLTEHKLKGIMHWSKDAGKSTGFVTTARVTHATPAALYASTVNRDWEYDRIVPMNSGIPYCTDIAAQLVHNNSDINVIMGGGRSNFIPITTRDPVTNDINNERQRMDGQNLIGLWKKDKEDRQKQHSIAYTKQQFDAINTANTDYVLGLFRQSHMSYELERQPDAEPSLSEMTKKAIKVLQKNQHGYFLMVEGARIDHGHHETRAKKALHDLLAFEEAVKTAMDMTNEEDTLIIVTADHSHTMTISGYPDRGNGILDLVAEGGHDLHLASDDLPYTTLNYANGHAHYTPRRDLTRTDTQSMHFQQTAAFPMSSETHSGEDVSVYARGPMAHLLTGVNEQNVIAYVMAHAACVGDTGIACETGRSGDLSRFNTASALTINCVIIALIVFVSVAVRWW